MRTNAGCASWLIGVVALACAASGGCSSQNESQPEAIAKRNEPLCSTQVTPDGTYQRVSVSEPSGYSLEIKLSVSANGQGHEKTTVLRKDDELIVATTVSDVAHEGLRAKAVFGPNSRQPYKEIVTETQDGIHFRGSVDGEPLQPFSMEDARAGAPLRFANGQAVPTPSSTVDEEVRGVFKALVQKAKGALESCSASDSKPSLPGIQEQSIPPHSWNHDEECAECRFKCTVKHGACTGGVVLACVEVCWLAGPLWWLCDIACSAAGWWLQCKSDLESCLSDCESDVCCPVTCGSKCCDTNETCADWDNELCCPAGTSVCPGPYMSCRYSNECCLPSGSGRACPCGNVACGPDEKCLDPATQECINDVVCDKSKVCFDKCCPALAVCTSQDHQCCTPESTPCNNNTKCCPGQNSCPGGVECCSVERSCGDHCCPNGQICNKMTNTCYAPTPCPDPMTQQKCVDAKGVEACCLVGANCCNGTCCGMGEACCLATMTCVPTGDKCISPW